MSNKRMNNRRGFLRDTASIAAALALAPAARVLATPSAASRVAADAAAPLVAIQIGPESFVDEGVDALLDWLKEKAKVNIVCLTTFTYGQGFAGRERGGVAYPG